MLTYQQEKLLKFISDFQLEKNVTPSFEEMKDGVNLKSKSGIHRMLSALEERGYIRKLNNRARAIEIIKNINFSNRNIQNDQEPHMSIPILGKIAAGLPIEAISDNTFSKNQIRLIASSYGEGFSFL